MINVHRYQKDYSRGRDTQFIKGKVFVTIQPIGDTATAVMDMSTNLTDDAVDDAVSILVRYRIAEDIKWIHKHNYA